MVRDRGKVSCWSPVLVLFVLKKKKKTREKFFFYDYSPSADLLLLLYNWAESERRSFISSPSGPVFSADPPPAVW